MDDHERMIRLLMMTAKKIKQWYAPIAARQLAEFDRQDTNAEPEADPFEGKDPTEAAGSKLSTMTNYIELADLWYRSGGAQGSQQDAYQLPGFVLEAVTVLPDDAVLLIGSWVRDELGLPGADPREMGQLWVEDVKGTAWRLLMEHGSWPEQHMERRRSFDPRD